MKPKYTCVQCGEGAEREADGSLRRYEVEEGKETKVTILATYPIYRCVNPECPILTLTPFTRPKPLTP